MGLAELIILEQIAHLLAVSSPAHLIELGLIGFVLIAELVSFAGIASHDYTYLHCLHYWLLLTIDRSNDCFSATAQWIALTLILRLFAAALIA